MEINNKQLYEWALQAGLDRQTFIKRAQRNLGVEPPLSKNQFLEVAQMVAGSPRLTEEQRQAVLSIRDRVDEGLDHQPFFRQSSPTPSKTVSQPNTQGETRLETRRDDIEFVLDEPDTVETVSHSPVVPSKTIPSTPPTPSNPSKTNTIDYATAAGDTVRGVSALIAGLMVISGSGIAYAIWAWAAGFSSNPWYGVGVGAVTLAIVWKWEQALRSSINTWWHQVQYRLFGGWVGFFISTVAMLLLLAPNVYQSYLASSKLASVIAPVHIIDDGSSLNVDEQKELVSVSSQYERMRQALAKEEETAALSDPTVLKFHTYEQAEIATAKRHRAEADKYRREGKKGAEANARWCTTLANRADARAKSWKSQKENAMVSVSVGYAQRQTQLNTEEADAKQAVSAKYRSLRQEHNTRQQQLLESSEGANKTASAIGFVLLPLADLAIFLLAFVRVNYFYKTNQVDPTLKPYKVGEKGKLQEFLEDVVGPAWETVFAFIRRIGYNYQAIADSAASSADSVRKLHAELAKVRQERKEKRIQERIARERAKI